MHRSSAIPCPRALLAVALASVTLACATAPARPAPAPAGTEVRFAPAEIQVSPLDLELAEKNDEELFAIGTAAYAAGDFRRAAEAFARIPDRFPGSRHEATALFDAGLAYQQQGEWMLALERFRALSRGYEGADALEAAFKVAECQYQLGELADAHATLEGIAARTTLPGPQRVRVLTQLGVVELEDHRPETAEATLRQALAAWQSLGDADRLDPYYPAQAEYYLGEAYRGWFLALAIDPSSGEEAKLQEALEHKSEMLLSAQGHYLRSIRMGDDRWAVASGYRVGELYDAFREQLLGAALPPDLDDEGKRVYREELRKRVRVLAAKAVNAYEAALGRAARAGVDDLRFLGQAQESLRRLQDALKDETSSTSPM